MKKTDYVAVFDSGLGGLSVLRRLKKQLPKLPQKPNTRKNREHVILCSLPF